VGGRGGDLGIGAWRAAGGADSEGLTRFLATGTAEDREGGGEEGKVGDDWPNGNGERQESRGAARASSRPSRARLL
jgi:hypothetical protein